jgi:hypothetical protein
MVVFETGSTYTRHFHKNYGIVVADLALVINKVLEKRVGIQRLDVGW